MTAVDRLAAIRARAEAATEGPWEAERIWHAPNSVGGHYCWDVLDAGEEGHDPEAFIRCIREDELDAEQTAEFIAHAREDIPALISEVESLRARLVASERISLAAIFLADALDTDDPDGAIRQMRDEWLAEQTAEVAAKALRDAATGDSSSPAPAEVGEGVLAAVSAALDRHWNYRQGHVDGVHCAGSVDCDWRGESVAAHREHMLTAVLRAAAPPVAEETEARDRKIAATAWDEGVKAIFDWWSAPEETRPLGVVNPYGVDGDGRPAPSDGSDRG